MSAGWPAGRRSSPSSTNSARRVVKVVDWAGGTGTKPAINKYVGAAGLVADIADGVDVRGTTGAAGTDGWTPTIAIVNDGARRVQKVVDWTGGSGVKPAVDKYVGVAGLVTDIADGIDVRGATGPMGNQLLSGSGAPGAGVGTNGDYYVDNDTHLFYGPKAAGAWPDAFPPNIGVDIQTFGASGTWTQHAGSVYHDVILTGAGGGGEIRRQGHRRPRLDRRCGRRDQVQALRRE